jgi:exodeoxyribonuclease V alpha subunit
VNAHTDHSTLSVMDFEGLVRRGVFNAIDVHFARFIGRLAGSADAALLLAAALVSRVTGEGHVCCDLAAFTGKELALPETVEAAVACPDLADWCEALRAASVVGRPGDYRPLILDDRGRLYLYRYWEYESELARFILDRCAQTPGDVDRDLLEDGLRRHFPEDASRAEPDWQRIAAATSLNGKFCVISGGPGTGKTTTVAKVLALMVEQAGNRPLRCALAAPTGKAAARLNEAIVSAKQKLACPDSVKAAIPEEASTIHRLLGTIPDSPYFRHDAKNPLVADVVIIDEASMVDLALMAKLIRALPPDARLILLGDKDQLASVEAGAVLGDICDTGNAHAIPHASGSGAGCLLRENGLVPSISGRIVELRKSYRFGGDSGLGAVSSAIRKGDGGEVLALLRDPVRKDLDWTMLPQPEKLEHALKDAVLRGFRDYSAASGFEEKMRAFERFRILCALRRGPYGALELNRLVEWILGGAGLIAPGQWYHGRPIMITTNDYNLRLFNGDIGIVLREEGADDLEGAVTGSAGRRGGAYALFPAAGGSARRFSPARLPAHETAYAMTVHKSQGSEFDDVLLLLSDRESPVLTRELLYTGITRARLRASVWGREDVLRSAVSGRIRRSSGLRDAIWGE